MFDLTNRGATATKVGAPSTDPIGTVRRDPLSQQPPAFAIRVDGFTPGLHEERWLYVNSSGQALRGLTHQRVDSWEVVPLVVLAEELGHQVLVADDGADEDLPYYEDVQALLAAEVGEDLAVHLAEILADAKMTRRVAASSGAVQVPADALAQLDMVMRFPALKVSIATQLLELIQSWPAGRPASSPVRVLRSERIVHTTTPSGGPWTGQLQVTVAPDGQVQAVVRPSRGGCLLRVPLADATTAPVQAVVRHG